MFCYLIQGNGFVSGKKEDTYMQPEVLEVIKMLPPAAKLAVGVTAAAAYLISEVRVQKVELDCASRLQKVETECASKLQKAEAECASKELKNQTQALEFKQKEFESNRLIANQADTIERLEQQSNKKWF